MTTKIYAPWTPEQVAALNRFQQYSGMHPFTCGNSGHSVSVVLMAHRDGWHCSDPECGYRQDWAHAFMADPSTWPKPFAAQQEQAAPVDWQAIAKQRETELKQVGEARHRAETELARLREGEEDSYDPRTVPTPGQWIHQFNQAPAAKRLEVVAATIEAAERGSTCFLMGHEKRLAAAEAAVARVHTLADRWKRNGTRDLARYADIMLGELDHPGPEETDTTPAELTAQEARDLADELSTDLYRAQDRLAFIAECLDAAEQGGSNAVEIKRVRLWLDGPKCGMQLAAENPGLYEKITAMVSGPLPPPGDTPPATVLKCSHAHLRQPHAPHRWQPQPGMRHVQCPGWEHVPAATRAADRPETDYDRLIAAGTPADHAARYAENGIATPGCDCGHDGMGEAWHGTTCIWRAFRKAAPAATEATSGPDTITDPEWLREQYAAAVERCGIESTITCWEIADAVLTVRDRHLQQLRQRLALADEIHRNQLDQTQERP